MAERWEWNEVRQGPLSHSKASYLPCHTQGLVTSHGASPRLVKKIAEMLYNSSAAPTPQQIWAVDAL